MRRFIWIGVIGLVVAAILIGFGVTKNIQTNQAYQTYMDEGYAAVNAGQYSKAENDFEDALTKKNGDTTATEALAAVKAYESASAKLGQKNYKQAQTAFAAVATMTIPAKMSQLGKRASEWASELKTVVKNRAYLAKLFTKAKQLSQTYQYAASNNKLALIFNFKDIKQAYYISYYKKAVALQTLNNQYLNQVGYGSTSSSSAVSSAQATSSSAFSQSSAVQSSTRSAGGASSSSSTTAGAKSGAGASSSSVNSATATVDPAEVQAARNLLAKLGANDKQYSDDQLTQFIRAARAKHQSLTSYFENNLPH